MHDLNFYFWIFRRDILFEFGENPSNLHITLIDDTFHSLQYVNSTAREKIICQNRGLNPQPPDSLTARLLETLKRALKLL